MHVFVFLLLSYCTRVEMEVYEEQAGGRTVGVTKHGSGDAWGVIGRAARLGLRASEHVVQTEDGYILRVFRVHRAGKKIGPPVLLMHGVLQNAGGWLDAGEASLAVQLAASGRDVWLGTARGSHYSRGHAWLHPDTDARYWRFSADEIGRHDLPAFLDYILTATGAAKLDYIGFSQGGGTFFIMCSERPHYCGKVNQMIALAPATRMLHTKSMLFRLVTEYCERNEQQLGKYGTWEALPIGSIVQLFLKNLCDISEAAKVCEAIINTLDSLHPDSLTGATIKEVLANAPAGTSVHNMAWFGQHVKSTYFHNFDYGPEQNLVRYGSEIAPAYNLSAVTVPTVVMYGKNDGIVDARDVKWLSRRLPNVGKVFEMEDPLWSHVDFVYSKDIPKSLFPKINEILGK